MFLAHYFNVPYAYMMGISDDRTEVFLTDEEKAEKQKLEVEQDEEQLLMLYRMLSPGMRKMIRTM